MTGRRAAFWVLALCFATYANALGNGFAYDDELIVVTNPTVTEGGPRDALVRPYWADARGGGTLFRPVTTWAFQLQWHLFDGEPRGFHAVNVLAHAAVALLVLALLWFVLPPFGALAGAAWFAAHPVHVEAVANVVGLAELLAAAAVVGAVLLYLHTADAGPGLRAVRAAVLTVLYVVGLGAKEIAVTMPGLLLFLEAVRPSSTPLAVRLKREAPLFLALSAALGAYLVWRGWVLGSVTGEHPSPVFFGVDAAGRVFTALAVLPQVVRLLVIPLDLSVDYAPAVLPVLSGPAPEVWAGVVVLVAVAAGVAATWRRVPVAAAGVLWAGLAFLPVSNVLFPVGVLLAERTLYLPSVGGALVVGAIVSAAAALPAARRRAGALAAALALVLLLMVRSVTRNPVWFSTFSVLASLNEDHPESYYAFWKRAEGLARVGLVEEATRQYEAAVGLVPGHYGLLCAAADHLYKAGRVTRAEELLHRARRVMPHQPNAYRLLAGQLLEQGRGREAHRAALEGLARWGSDRQLWAFLAESYVLKGDLPAAVRALDAALAAGGGASERARRDQLLEIAS